MQDNPLLQGSFVKKPAMKAIMNTYTVKCDNCIASFPCHNRTQIKKKVPLKQGSLLFSSLPRSSPPPHDQENGPAIHEQNRTWAKW